MTEACNAQSLMDPERPASKPSPKKKADVGRRVRGAAGAFLDDRRHNPNLHFRVDLATQMNDNGIQTEFLQRTRQTDLIGRNVEAGPLQGVGHFRRPDGTVKMPFVVGVGLDRDALTPQLHGKGFEAGQVGVIDGLQLRPVLGHHPLVMLRGDRGQPLGNQTVHGIAAFHLDYVALLAEVFDRLNQQQLDAAMRPLGQTLGSMRHG